MSDEEWLALENEYKYGSDHRVCVRCRAILLKSLNFSNAEVAEKLNVSELSVLNWTKRYTNEGISGAETKGGKNRFPEREIPDYTLVWDAVSQDRKRIKAAKALCEVSSRKRVSENIFKRLFKAT